MNYQSFVCAEVSTVFYACYLMICVFEHFVERFLMYDWLSLVSNM